MMGLPRIFLFPAVRGEEAYLEGFAALQASRCVR